MACDSFFHSFNFELWSGDQTEVIGCLAARRSHDWIVFGKRNGQEEGEMGEEGTRNSQGVVDECQSPVVQ